MRRLLLLTTTCLVVALSVNVILALNQESGVNAQATDSEWYMAGANPERTSWTPEEVRGNLEPVWYRPIEPYISQNMQIIAAEGKLFISTARGLYALNATNGDIEWVYPTELPLGHSPTYHEGVLYVGGFDRKLHAIDAATGTRLWTFDEAKAGYRTNPLVVSDLALLGNRDGWFYAIHAHGTPNQGTLAWKYQTEGPILYSAAYKKDANNQDVIFFASQDMHAYALYVTTGGLKWKSEKLHGAGFNSWWPVIWHDKVVLVTAPNYRNYQDPGASSCEAYNTWYDPENPILNTEYLDIQRDSILPDGDSPYPNGRIGPDGTEPGDWVDGTKTIDASLATEYFEEPTDAEMQNDPAGLNRINHKPWHRSHYFLDIETGTDWGFDYDGDGKLEYAPILLTGTRNGIHAPPMVSGYDNVLYQQNIYYKGSEWSGAGHFTGWKLGTPFISEITYDYGASDEPYIASGGGSLLYFSLCCDRWAGWIDISKPLGEPSRQGMCFQLNLERTCPGYNEMWFGTLVEDMYHLWGYYGSLNGIYHNHTADQNPLVPYNGHLYIHRSNTILSFGPEGGAQKLPLAEIQEPPEETYPGFSETELKQMLADEIQKWVDAGHLHPGWFNGGQFNGVLNDYFQNPMENIWVLLRALSHLPPDLQQATRDFIQGEYQAYDLDSRFATIGWRDGVTRDWFLYPPEVEADLQNFGPGLRPAPGLFWRYQFPPMNFYALWKYAEEFGGAVEIYNAVKDKLTDPPDDTDNINYPYQLNAYIAGYWAYLELEALAEEPESASVRDTLDSMLQFRVEDFSKDTPFVPDDGVEDWKDGAMNRVNISRNFIYMVPELGLYLHDHARSKVQEAVEEYNYVAPYWFVSRYEGCLEESTIQNLHDYYALFQAKAWILQEPREELVKYLDVPGFMRGDLFYIHNLISAIEAQPAPGPGPTIQDVTTNLADYPNGQVPRYEKLELTFQVDTMAQNPQLPYDPAPPPGVEPEIGVTVDALFTPDDWQTVYTQPAFYYQEFEDQVKSGSEWFYPTDNFTWKIRFAPNQVGTWEFKLQAQDVGGITETPPQSFTVVSSDNKGFVRVSQTDSRYFEYDDGTYFPALGYNMNAQSIDWVNPVLSNEEHFQKMGQNGIQLIRLWLSQWGIYTSAWNPWNSPDPAQHAQYIPLSGIVFYEAYPDSELSMMTGWDYTWYGPCMFIGGWKAKPAVKRNTDYRVRVRYKTLNITGPRIAGHPYGFVAKTGLWLWGAGNYCYDPEVGTVVTAYQSSNTPDWEILEGAIHIGDSNTSDFLPYFYLALDNVNSGEVYVDYVWIEEDLGDGQYGPNIVSKPWMDHHRYMEQRNSYAFDKLLNLAEQYDVYLRPVVLEKNEPIFNRIDYDGNFSRWGDGNSHFYGNWRNMTKVRWLQQAWWRYLQARWGYSTSIHSWELLNEGDPWNGLHYTLADEFGKYMHQFTPNDHLVSTSCWHSFPKDDFWANPDYPDVGFADYHRYIPESDSWFTDTAQATYDVSIQYGANQPGGAGKPVIRGETGFVVSGGEPPTDQFQNDTEGVWLHNFIWGGINAGGLMESYWYENVHIYGHDFDHRPHYAPFYNFIKDIPLNNGNYQDAEAVVSNEDLRAWGQKDLLEGRAHLWIQNKGHTWKNVVDGVSIPAVSGTVEVSGFQPGESYTVEWWDTYQPDPTQQIVGTESLVAQPDGSISISVDNLTTDVAIRIIAVGGSSTPADVIVDNRDPGFSVVGSWLTYSGPPYLYYGDDFRYDEGGTGSEWATFAPDLPRAGRYEVFIWWGTSPDRATNAPHTVHHLGGTTTVRVNMRGPTGGGVWYSLGAYDFAAGAAGSVVVSDDADGYVGADAVRFLEVCPLPGDVNCDCAVDIVDIMLVASRWHTSCDDPDPDNNPDTPNYESRYDLNHDCDIDIVDIMLVAAHWGDTCPTPTPM